MATVALTFITGTVGKGKATHAVFELGEHKGETVCGKTATATGDRLDISQAGAFTCRSCWRAIPSWARTTVEIETVTERIDRELTEEKQREQTPEGHAARYHAGGNCVLGASCMFPAPRELDIWLTEGVVLISPMLDEARMIFQRWEGGMAVLRHEEDGTEHRVSQSYVTTWLYVPRAGDFNQVWRSKETGDLVRIVDTTRDAVRLRGMQPEDRPFWLSREMLAEHFTWAPEAGE